MVVKFPFDLLREVVVTIYWPCSRFILKPEKIVKLTPPTFSSMEAVGPIVGTRHNPEPMSIGAHVSLAASAHVTVW